MRRTPLEHAVTRRFVPFGAMGVLAIVATALPLAPADRGLFVAATVLTVLIAVAVLTLPWSRFPRITYVLPALAYFVVIGLLRGAQGGAASGYVPLAILPVLWIALTLGRRE